MHNPDTTLPYDTFIAQAAETGQRLDRYLTPLVPDVSRTTIQHMIAEGGVLVNGHSSKAGYALRDGDTIRVYHMLPSAQQSHAKPQSYPLEIVYEDNDLLVINKAAGMVVHPAPGHYEDTLVNALLARYPQLQELQEGVRPGIVHRLDKDTSGLLIIAKNTRTQATLIEMLRQHAIMKRYLALVEGNVSLDHGSIDAPIGRDPRNRQQMAITATGSREARTHFRVLERFARHTLLLLELETGRTHQIRVHLKAIGHPVVGDIIYGSGHSKREPLLQRQFLHAYQLKFQHPTTGETVELEVPLPEDLQAVLEQKNFL
ncbi:MAG TPA: RluA family pseudouridine synthase [Ktedonobacteraceae bacterium]|nr:RluA family pseudouridine synthase [Ktedonobacteraceae bacterium]